MMKRGRKGVGERSELFSDTKVVRGMVGGAVVSGEGGGGRGEWKGG
jgi:hypothetical protein